MSDRGTQDNNQQLYSTASSQLCLTALSLCLTALFLCLTALCLCFQVQINGFSEQDQENLYMATQAGKSAGKKGLGKSSQGKPIGGAKWEGTKTAFDGDEETTGAAAAATAAEPAVEPAVAPLGVADTGIACLQDHTAGMLQMLLA